VLQSSIFSISITTRFLRVTEFIFPALKKVLSPDYYPLITSSKISSILLVVCFGFGVARVTRHGMGGDKMKFVLVLDAIAFYLNFF